MINKLLQSVVHLIGIYIESKYLNFIGMNTNDLVARYALEVSGEVKQMVKDAAVVLVSPENVFKAAVRATKKCDFQSKEMFKEHLFKSVKAIINYWKTQEKML